VALVVLVLARLLVLPRQSATDAPFALFRPARGGARRGHLVPAPCHLLSSPRAGFRPDF
jgi:hypothetical protein